MSWREDLQPASIGGVPIEVISSTASFGRRIAMHEYPKRDIPMAEDMGRKLREHGLTAFVIGDDFRTKRDNVIEVCEKGGALELVHPDYGRMQVVIESLDVSHDITEGGMARLQFTIKEAGESKYPSASASTQTQVQSAADAMEAASTADFAKGLGVQGLPAFVADDAVAQFSNALSMLESGLDTAVFVTGDPLGALQNELSTLITTPSTLANRFFGLFNKASSVISNISRGSDNTRNVSRINAVVSLASQFTTTSTVTGTPARQTATNNSNAIKALVRQALITQSAGMISQIDLPVYDDAVSLKTDLLAAIDDELLTANDDVYVPLETLRAKVNADTNTRIKNAARIQVIQPSEIKSALVLAYDLYENVAREDEIINRNKVRHPGFVPAEEIKVLSV